MPPRKRAKKKRGVEHKIKKQKVTQENKPKVLKKVHGVQYNPETRRCEFEVEWRPTRKGTAGPRSVLTIDEIVTTSPECPHLLLQMEIRELKKWTAANRANNAESTQWEAFARAPLDSLPVLLPTEYVMVGNEMLKKIYSRVEFEIGDSSGKKYVQTYFVVRFHGVEGDDFLTVQQPYLDYYFPNRVALFLLKSEGFELRI
jgi:hypothetical protein